MSSQNTPNSKPTRRSFLVAFGSAIIGSYFLPPGKAIAGILEAVAGPEAVEPVRYILTLPSKTYTMNNRFILLWMEAEDCKAEVMIWKPENEQEMAEAQRFYDDVRGFNRFDPTGELAKKLVPPHRSAAEKAIIQEILNNWDNLEAQLRYADLLQQRGDSQGEFIKTSILLSRLDPGDPEAEKLDSRWEELFDNHTEDWYRDLTILGVRPDYGNNSFFPMAWMSEHGLIQRLEIHKPGVLPNLAETVFAIAPFVQQLQFDYDGLDIGGLCQRPEMQQIKSLQLNGVNLNWNGLKALVGAEQFKNLNELEISANNFGSDMGTALAESKILGHLESLNLATNRLGPVGVKALVSSPACRNLKQLNLTANCLTPLIDENGNVDLSAMEALCGTPHLPNLRSLNLSNAKLTVAAIQLLQRSQLARQLEELILEGCELLPQTIKALSSVPFEQIKKLNLSSNNVGTGTQALAQSAYFSTLEVLTLSNAKLNDTSVQALSMSRHLGNLTELNLENNEIGDRGIRSLATSATYKNLKILNLGNNQCGTAGVRAIANSPHLADLTNLVLTNNPIGPAGAQALIDSPFFLYLRNMTLSQSDIGDEGANKLLVEFGSDRATIN